MLLTKEDLEQAADIDPTILEYLSNNPQPPAANWKDITSVRSMLAKMEEDMSSIAGPTPQGVSEVALDIPLRDGYKSPTRIYKRSSGSPGPLIVLAFGGGFVAGSNNQFTMIARPLVRLFGATVVSISYRLAPEHKFPAGQLDAWDNMKWIAENAAGESLHADPSKGFIMGGVSAGGSLASCLSRKFQEEPLAHSLTGQWLCIA